MQPSGMSTASRSALIDLRKNLSEQAQKLPGPDPANAARLQPSAMPAAFNSSQTNCPPHDAIIPLSFDNKTSHGVALFLHCAFETITKLLGRSFASRLHPKYSSRNQKKRQNCVLQRMCFSLSFDKLTLTSLKWVTVNFEDRPIERNENYCR